MAKVAVRVLVLLNCRFVFQSLHKELDGSPRETRRLREPATATEHYMDRISSPDFLCAQWWDALLQRWSLYCCLHLIFTERSSLSGSSLQWRWTTKTSWKQTLFEITFPRRGRLRYVWTFSCAFTNHEWREAVEHMIFFTVVGLWWARFGVIGRKRRYHVNSLSVLQWIPTHAKFFFPLMIAH